ncbi:MAG: MCE family protein [Acaryochloridaceae cyanobacterium RU_4_10]|nr:MCE family protein [Acaryochloridaceae cyanobacterium RU_4_10]
MQSRAVREGSVGLFILLGLGAVLGAIAWVRGANFGGHYALAVELSDALGLNAGSAVKYRGIKVGQVRSLTPSVNGVLAQVEIMPASLVIPRNSLVEVTQSGFIGQVELSIRPKDDKDKNSVPTQTIATLSPFQPKCDETVILCDGDRLNASVGANFDELIRSTTKLATVLGDSQLLENTNNTLKHFSTTAQSLTQLSRSGNKTLRDVSGAANGFTGLSRDARQQLQQVGRTATSLTTAANQVTALVQVNRSSLASTLGNLQGASQDLKVAVKSLSPIISRVEKGKLLDNLETLAENGAKASANLKTLTSTANNPVMLLGLAQTLDSARATFQNTQKITTDLEQVTGNPKFRQNLIKLINGLSKLVSSTDTLDQQLSAMQPQEVKPPEMSDRPTVLPQPQILVPQPQNSPSLRPAPTLVYKDPPSIKPRSVGIININCVYKSTLSPSS